jgi:hypothetical protein
MEPRFWDGNHGLGWGSWVRMAPRPQGLVVWGPLRLIQKHKTWITLEMLHSPGNQKKIAEPYIIHDPYYHHNPTMYSLKWSAKKTKQPYK